MKEIIRLFLGCWISIFLICIGCATIHKQADMEEDQVKIMAKPPTQEIPSRTKGSLWPGENQFNTMFMDSKARRVGDIVTIRVIEVAEASKEAATSTNRDSTIDVGIDNLFGIETNIASINKGIDPSKLIATRANSEYSGKGVTTRKGRLTTSISAVVKEVLSNGNLIIEGKRKLAINNENQFVILQGMVRPEDISPANVVLSTAIADANIIYTGRGIIADKQRPGWFIRILDIVWPF
jgi:flagellar L-ring protein FlgH